MRGLAKEYAQLRLQSAMAAPERKELRQSAWEAVLAENLKATGKSENELEAEPRKQPGKLDLALKLRSETGASIAWLAQRLHLGKATTVRGYLPSLQLQKN